MRHCFAVLGSRYTVLASSAETEDRFSLLHVEMSPGAEIPLHYHTQADESFYVLSGEVEVSFGKGKRTLSAGQFQLVPRRTIHGLRNATATPVSFLLWQIPGGIEAFLLDFARVVWPTDREHGQPTGEQLRHLLTIAPRYGVVMVGP